MHHIATQSITGKWFVENASGVLAEELLFRISFANPLDLDVSRPATVLIDPSKPASILRDGPHRRPGAPRQKPIPGPGR
jgi:hypothetical protein